LPPFGIAGGMDQFPEGFFLHSVRMIHKKRNLVDSFFHDPRKYRIQQFHKNLCVDADEVLTG
jgi:hypothetical protein